MPPRRTRPRVVLALVLAGCGESVASLAESPPEPTIWAAQAADGAPAISGDIRFADGTTLGARTVSPTSARPGTPLVVEFPASGLTGWRALWVGLRAPRAAARQEIAGQSRRLVGPLADPRDRWVEASVLDGSARAELVVPDDWHATHAVLLAEPRDDGRASPAVAGPRLDRGAGVLAVVPVTTRPTRVLAPRAAGVEVDGRVLEWSGPALLLGESLDGEPDETATAIDLQALGDDALAAGRGTTVRVAWDATFLYVAASLPDADLWTDYTAQDDPLYKQEAFEFFVAADGSGDRYLEVQVSARGVTFDARFPRYRAGDEAWDSSFRAAVDVSGTLTPGDRDRGWSTELAIPWTEICAETGLQCPPAPGMRLRVNAFRLERPDRRRTRALALSPTRAPDFHAWANAAELELQ